MSLSLGLVALTSVLAISVQCLPYRITSPSPPWYPAYGMLDYLAFPVNVLTNELSQGVVLAPLSLVMNMILGALSGSALSTSRPSISGN
jgi:hypothetical protein